MTGAIQKIDYEKRLFNFQKADVQWLAERKRALLLLEQGLGKTVIGLRAADAVGAENVVVVCPAVARGNWRREYFEWSLTRPNMQVFSYTELARGATVDVSQFIDVLILDEAQYLKSPEAQRTKAIYGSLYSGTGGLLPYAKRVWCLTGTLLKNGPHEVYTHLRALWPTAMPYRTQDEFMYRYCNYYMGTYGPIVKGLKPNTAPRLRRFLRKIARRRTKVETLPDLPPIRFADLTMTHEGARQAIDQHRGEFDPIATRLLKALEEEDWFTVMDLTRGHTARLRKILGLAKVPAVCEAIESLMGEGDHKVIVFAWHKDVISALKKRLKSWGVVGIDGRTPEDKRNIAIDRFQNDPKTRIFVGQIIACGTAITLTAASRVLFAEASWTPDDNAQAAARAHRIGQTRGVLVQFMGLEGSIDEALMRVCRRKTAACEEVWTEDDKER